METLPREIVRLLRLFEDVFSERVWDWVQVLVVGAILTPGQRTVAAVLRVMGLSDERQFQNYHRVLNRARWSSRELSRRLLAVLVQVVVAADAPVVVGLDETIERRRGAKIAAKGIYRDPVRSSKSHFVKVSGLRWISMQVLAEIAWAGRVWGLPFLTVLAPSERYDQTHGRRHKTLPTWGRQMIRQLRRWLPDRALVVVADSTYAVLELLADAAALPRPVTVVTRLRLDAALYAPAPPRAPGTPGRPRIKGERQPTLATRLLDPATGWETLTVPWYGGGTAPVEAATGTALWYHPGQPPVALRWVLLRDPAEQFEPQALLSTDPTALPAQMIAWFVARWPLEVTFREVRAHLGVETQRQWSDLAILRTTPALLGLFSLVTLCAHARLDGQPLPARQAAWYAKSAPTFSDTLAFVRRRLWPVTIFSTSPSTDEVIEIPRALFDRLTDTLAFAA
ncbi:MAG TPA: transposase [Gemmatimonadales bacterium]|jgi:DDE superfamily endonuclease|nr:transposase [Gemmatimonadales bacterium]